MKTQALQLSGIGASDYELVDGHASCWITINNVSVYVRNTGEGVSVSLHPVGREDEGSLAETCTTFAEAAEDN